MSSHHHHRRDAGLKFDDFAMTLEEVSRELGVTRERVRQIENQALTKSRRILRKWGYTLQDLLDGERHG